MIRLLGSIGVLLATASLAAASVAQEQEPPGPAFASTYRYQFTPDFGRSINFCASQLATLPNNRPAHGFVLNLLSNPFLPPLDTPVERFRSPPGFVWRPEQDRWRVYSEEAIRLAEEYCFGVPVTRAPKRGEVVQITVVDRLSEDLAYIASVLFSPKPKRGDLPLVYTLPQQDVTATFTSPSSACGLVRNFTSGLKIGVRNNFATIVEPRSGDTVKGTVNPKTYTFKATGATEVYAGGIKDLVAWASYGYTRIFGGQPCTAGYLARINLIRPATIAPACKSPQIVAPRTVSLRSGRARFRFGARCAGRYVAGVRMRTRLLVGDRVRPTGTFRTRATPVPITLRLEDEHSPLPRERVFFSLRSPAQMGLGPSSKLVEILFPPR